MLVLDKALVHKTNELESNSSIGCELTLHLFIAVDEFLPRVILNDAFRHPRKETSVRIDVLDHSEKVVSVQG